MDIIKFNNPNFKTKMEQAQIIEGITSKTWIERYTTAGEFTFVAPVSSGMKDLLPIGCFVSHVNSDYLQIVENHEINETNTSSPNITITGRGFETFLENRVVDSNKVFPISGVMTDYALDSEHTWNQAVTLISDHILASMVIDPNNAIPFVEVISTVIPLGTETPETARTIKRGDLYAAVLDLLKIDGFGINVIRPGASSPLTAGSPDLAIVVHAGVDKTASVIFNYDTGEIISADYLWSNKNLKNSALVTGTYVEVMVIPPGGIEYDRRTIYIDASDLDKIFTSPPLGTDMDNIVNAMTQRGMETLASQNNTVLTKAETAKSGVKAIYRQDFNIGDLVTVNGNYNEVSSMRVTEYAEIEDNTGETEYPTLTALA